MNHIEFAKKCQPLNKKYYELYGDIPIVIHYVATKEEYLIALQKAVNNKVKIETYLKKLKQPKEKGAKL